MLVMILNAPYSCTLRMELWSRLVQQSCYPLLGEMFPLMLASSVPRPRGHRYGSNAHLFIDCSQIQSKPFVVTDPVSRIAIFGTPITLQHTFTVSCTLKPQGVHSLIAMTVDWES